MYVQVYAKESLCACTSVSEWKRENVSLFESERESLCVGVNVFVCERENVCVCVCVCMCVKKREYLFV